MNLQPLDILENVNISTDSLLQHAVCEPSVSVGLSDWLTDVCRLWHCVCPLFCPPTHTLLSIRPFDFVFLLCLYFTLGLVLPNLVLIPRPPPTRWLWASGTSSYLHTFYLPVPLISRSDCASIFPYLPAVALCFISFMCGSHQTLAPDWFSCEQGCSGGPGTSSAGFEDPSRPLRCPRHPTTLKTLSHLWVWEAGMYWTCKNTDIYFWSKSFYSSNPSL